MNQKNKKITSYFVIFSLLLIGIIYAILQANLQINGIAKIKSNTWDIHFDNIQVNENSVSIGTGDSQATIDPENNCKVDFEVTLSTPGDFYEFTVDVVNAGTIDGMIGELNKTLKVNNEVVSEVPDYLTYSVTYADGLEILENHKLEAGETETYKVKLEFNTNIEELPSAATITTSLEPQYIQADTGAINRPTATFIDGKSFNVRIKELAGDTDPTYRSTNHSITAFRKSINAPDMNSITSDNMVSISASKPIYVWFDSGTIYYYSDSNKVYLNEDSSYMFGDLQDCAVFEANGLDTSRVTNMSSMFEYFGEKLTTFSLDLSSWNVSNVTDMSYIFIDAGYEATSWTMNISNWNTSKVTDMQYMFGYAAYNVTTNTWSIVGIENLNTSKVTNMYDMFHCAGYKSSTFSLNLSNWNVSNVTNMSYMFSDAAYNASTISLNISTWNTSKVENMYNMFYSFGYNVPTLNLNLSSWNVSNVTNMQNMFSFTGRYATSWSLGDLSGWRPSKAENMNNMFSYSGREATSWTVGDLSNWTTSSATNMSYMFAYAGENSSTWSIGDISNWDTSHVDNMQYMFGWAGYQGTWTNIGTLKVYADNISMMFFGVEGIKATLKIYNNPSNYSMIFNNAAKQSGSGITVNYTSSVTDIDNIIATKSNSSNIVKGSVFTP